MIVDTHIHLCDPLYEADFKAVLQNADVQGVKKIINTGADMEENRLICARDFGTNVYRTIGFHPHYADKLTPEIFEEIKHLIKTTARVVAVGEIGLDYFNNPVPKDIQAQTFIKLLALCDEFDLPVSIHIRDAYDDAVKILKEHSPKRRGVIHCFTQGYDTALEFTKLGYLLGIGGVLTFKNALPLKAAVKQLELKCMVLETDAPYLAPGKYRGKRNESAYLSYVVAEIATIKGCTIKEVEESTTHNAEKLFRI
ncbi:MAG: TatD family hydrolase [bacterium]